MKEKESFVFYRSFAKSIDRLPSEMQLPLYRAITAYALDLELPDFSVCSDRYVLDALWEGIRPQLDANHKRYLNGLKGGAPKGSRNNPSGRRGKGTNLELTKNKPNENDNDNDNALAGEVSMADSTNTHSKRFVKPTPDEVKKYCSEKGYSVDVDQFCDYYESNGWVVGKTPMRDWRATVRTWVRNEKKSHAVSPSVSAGKLIGPVEIIKMMNNND